MSLNVSMQKFFNVSIKTELNNDNKINLELIMQITSNLLRKTFNSASQCIQTLFSTFNLKQNILKLNWCFFLSVWYTF